MVADPSCFTHAGCGKNYLRGILEIDRLGFITRDGKPKPLLRIIRYGSPVSGKAGRMTSAGVRPAELRLRKTGRRSPGGVVRCLPFADDAFVFSPVDINIQRGVEPDMPHRLALVDGRHRVEPPFVEPAVAHERVDRQVADAERGQILEKMRAQVNQMYTRSIYVYLFLLCICGFLWQLPIISEKSENSVTFTKMTLPLLSDSTPKLSAG